MPEIKTPTGKPWAKMRDYIISQNYTDQQLNAVNAEQFNDMLPTVFPQADIKRIKSRLQNRRSAILNIVRDDLRQRQAEASRLNIESLLSAHNATVTISGDNEYRVRL